MLFILLCNECKETPTQFKLKVFYMLQLNICLGLLSCFSLVRLLLKLWLGLGTITTCLGLENIMVDGDGKTSCEKQVSLKISSDVIRTAVDCLAVVAPSQSPPPSAATDD